MLTSQCHLVVAKLPTSLNFDKVNMIYRIIASVFKKNIL